MIRRLRAWLSGDPPDRPLAEQMRAIWRVPADWTLPTSARVVPTRKAQTIDDWRKKWATRRSA